MAESEEKLKSLLMKVKEDSEKADLKLNPQKTKIMASDPITLWQIEGETVETVTHFIFLGSRISADGDCRHEIKRCLLLGRKAMTHLDSILKKQTHFFANKSLYSQSYGFCSSHVQMWKLDHKEGWAPKNWCLWSVVLEFFVSPFGLQGFPGGSDGKASAHNAGDLGSIPGLGRSPGEGNGNPLQYSCLENPMDRGAGRLQSMGSPRIGHDWATSLSLWTAGRSNQSILKEINPEYSLEGLMLKLKLWYFGHVMRRANSLERLMAGKDCSNKKEWTTDKCNSLDEFPDYVE